MLFYLYWWLMFTLICSIAYYCDNNIEASKFRSKTERISFIKSIVEILLIQLKCVLITFCCYNVFYYIPIYLYNL